MLTDAEIARETEIKELKTALVQDGPAWVKVKIEPASPSHVLECGNQKGLWKLRKGEEQFVEVVPFGGDRKLRRVWKFIQEEPLSVPFKMVSGETEITVSEWWGIEGMPDLLQARFFFTKPLVELPQDSRGLMKTGLTRNLREEFLLSGLEAWAFGKFVNGKPQVYLNGKFYLTGLSPEGFATNLENGFGARVVGNFLGILGIVFLLLFLKIFLKNKT